MDIIHSIKSIVIWGKISAYKVTFLDWDSVNAHESLSLKGSFHLHFRLKSLYGYKEMWGGEGEVGSAFQPYGQEYLQAEAMGEFQPFPSPT